MNNISPRDYARFWTKVSIAGPDDCWLWKMSKDSYGYGRLKIKGRFFTAPRLALGFYLGRPVSRDMSACHTCDNPACVNPSHLFEASHQENMRDMAQKGRASGPPEKNRGEANPRAKLNWRKVTQIRSASARGECANALAEMHGITAGHVRSIVGGKAWRQGT